MSKCYMCGNDLTEGNKSFEHIIPNSIGGKLKSSSLLCIACNSSSGDGADAELAKQLNPFANMLNIKRDRGRPQEMRGVGSDSGIPYDVFPGGKPKLTKPTVKIENVGENQKRVKIVARNKSEATKILKNIKKKYPNTDIDKLLGEAKHSNGALNEKVSFQFQFGGVECEKSLIKSILNYYFFMGGKGEFVEDAISFLKGDEVEIKNTPNYLDVISANEDEVIHSIIIIGSSENKILYANIELFSTISYMVVLNDNYDGNNVEFTLFFNVLNGCMVEKEYNIDSNRDSVLKKCSEFKHDYEVVRRRMTRVLEISQNINDRAIREEMISKVISETWSKYEEGCEITREMKDELSQALQSLITSYISGNSNPSME